eukprot:TRINITY_DN8154_c0_g2_i1.p1 TRINITY_DN8154_c0_g2~~TRINITY_DN8154_c0_g2_i1.p1  ORF type:complete len:100 (-),score=24.65 TRINITY_DN8154_c0_g2_i1:31-330(-)
MFTRRYIIHTSMGNNPTKITLRGFVASRAPWPNPNDTLLLEIAKEELETVMQVENDIHNRNGGRGNAGAGGVNLSLIHISEPTRLLSISYAVFCLKKKN